MFELEFLQILPAKVPGQGLRPRSKMREGCGVGYCGEWVSVLLSGNREQIFALFYVTALKTTGDRDHIHPRLLFCR